MIHHPLVLLWGVLIGYGAGVVSWWLRVFFTLDYWTWGDVLNGLIWPWLWLRQRWRRHPGNGS